MTTTMSPEQQLHLAVKENNQSKIEKLLNDGVDINCLFYGWSPLQYAISLGKCLSVYQEFKIFKILILF